MFDESKSFAILLKNLGGIWLLMFEKLQQVSILNFDFEVSGVPLCTLIQYVYKSWLKQRNKFIFQYFASVPITGKAVLTKII